MAPDKSDVFTAARLMILQEPLSARPFTAVIDPLGGSKQISERPTGLIGHFVPRVLKLDNGM